MIARVSLGWKRRELEAGRSRCCHPGFGLSTRSESCWTSVSFYKKKGRAAILSIVPKLAAHLSCFKAVKKKDNVITV